MTVSRWYSPGDVNESGRMIVLALATMIDRGVADPAIMYSWRGQITSRLWCCRRHRSHPTRLNLLRDETRRLGFQVLAAPDVTPNSEVLRNVVAAKDLVSLDRAAGAAFLDLTVPTDNRPFFFNQLRFATYRWRSASFSMTSSAKACCVAIWWPR